MGAVPARAKRLMHVPHGHLEHTKVSFPDKLQPEQDQVSSEGSIRMLEDLGVLASRLELVNLDVDACLPPHSNRRYSKLPY